MRSLITIILIFIPALLFCQDKYKIIDTDGRKPMIKIDIPSYLSKEMTFIEGGTFNMGSNDGGEAEKPIHKVTLNSFYIGKHEVTQALWRNVMGNNPSNFDDNSKPVEQITWSYVQLFLAKLNKITGKKYRLPTEAEWEYAARGGNKSKNYIYAGSNNPAEIAWTDGYNKQNTYPVGSKKPNELGLYDMSGNVWEWCNDWYAADYYANSPVSNPIGPFFGSDRVARGGSYYYPAMISRTSFRCYYNPSRYSVCDLGFRLACSL